jgi:16S rRNA processing protein RimM
VDEPENLTIASVVKPQGNRGEVIAELLTDFPDRFDLLQSVTLYKEGRPIRELVLTDHWLHKGRVVLKFQGIDSISAAEELRGLDLMIPRDQAVPLPEGSYYQFELRGCKVKDPSGKIYGVIEEVMTGQGQVLLRILHDGHEFLIPFVEPFLRKIDVHEKEIVCDLPEGLITL